MLVSKYLNYIILWNPKIKQFIECLVIHLFYIFAKVFLAELVLWPYQVDASNHGWIPPCGKDPGLLYYTIVLSSDSPVIGKTNIILLLAY